MATTSSYTDPTVVSSTANENRIRTPLEERERKERACWQVVIFICDFALPPLGVFLQVKASDPAAQHEMTDLPAGSTAYVSDAGVADHNPYVKSGPGAV
eukprot:jgi/Mesen1/8055/ME000043S07440